MQPVQEWPLSHIKEWEGSTDHFKFVSPLAAEPQVNHSYMYLYSTTQLVVEEWQAVNTVFAVQIAQYLSEIMQLISGQCERIQ